MSIMDLEREPPHVIERAGYARVHEWLHPSVNCTRDALAGRVASVVGSWTDPRAIAAFARGAAKRYDELVAQKQYQEERQRRVTAMVREVFDGK